MHLREVIEGIRMGARDLAAASKKRYTIGLEFEVSVKDDYDSNFDADSDDYEDDEPSPEELYDQFSDQWYNGGSTFDFEDWFRDFIRYNDGLKTIIDDIEPRYGWVDIEDFVEYKHQEHLKSVERKKMRYSTKDIQKAQQFLKLFPDEESLGDNIEQVKNLIRFVYNDIKRYSQYETDQEWQDLFDSMTDERLMQNAKTAFNTVHYIENDITNDIGDKDYAGDYEDDFEEERYVYGDEEKSVNKIIDIEEDINDSEDVLQYFDTDLSGLSDVTDNDWIQAEQEEMDDAFNDWVNYNRRGSTGKINYVRSLIKDIRKSDWKVVEDGTQGVDAEIVTGVMDIEEGIDAIRSIFELIGSNENLFTNTATGLHINIGTWNGVEWKSVDWLKFLIVYRADKALEAFERQFNTFATDKLPNIISDLEKNRLEAFYDNIDTVNNIVRNLSPKMSAVNLSKLPEKGHIEIRAPGGADYHKKTDIVINQIQRAIRALEIASDPKSYKNQYVKRLYKMLSKQKEKVQGSLPAEKFFRQFGIKRYVGNDVLDIIVTAIRVSDRVDNNIIDRLYNMSIHKQIVTDLRRVGRYTADRGDIGSHIRRVLKQHDTSGRFAQSKFMKHILAAFPETTQQTPQSQNEPAMSGDEMRSLVNKSS